jgi:hypothetical protein
MQIFFYQKFFNIKSNNNSSKNITISMKGIEWNKN